MDNGALTSITPPARSRELVIAVVMSLLLVVLGWAWLGLMVADYALSGEAARLGPGAGLIDRLIGPQTLDPLTRAFVESLCRPVFGTERAGTTAFVMSFSMWAAMALAMMLPTAVPMVVSYAETADARAAQGEKVASSLWLMLGYLAVWLIFALAAALAQMALARLSLLDPVFGTVNGLFAGAILLAAGLYQFTPAKGACLARCQRPLPFFIARWSDAPMGVFRLGVRQGLDCFGCCAATMVAAFAFGVMNPVWMIGAGLVMTIEKLTETPTFSRLVGTLLAGLGAYLLISAIMARLPG